jgi:hypothetical protein
MVSCTYSSQCISTWNLPLQLNTSLTMTTYQALFHESADSYLTLKEFTVPPSIPLGSALIKPLYSNLASYARATSDGKYVRPISFPFVPGHSCVGRIEAVGADGMYSIQIIQDFFMFVDCCDLQLRI